MQRPKERLAIAQWVLERNLGWIAAAEIKVGVVVAIDTAMLGGLAAVFSAASLRTPCGVYLSIAAAASTVIALVCAAVSVLPRVSGPSRSLLFFSRIAEQRVADYIKALKNATDSQLLEDCAAQIHRNAQIADIKHRWVRRSMVWSFFAAIPWGAAVGILLYR